MKRISAILIVIVCSCGNKNYNPNNHLTVEKRSELTDSLVRYIGVRPENVPVEKRFDPIYSKHFQMVASEARLEYLYVDNDQYYIAISQPAPSLVVKRTITGIRLTWDGKSSIKEYEEVFRTWKMVPDTLTKNSLPLFERMIKGENLDPSKAKGGEKSRLKDVEFPDKYVYFDKVARVWKNY